MFQNPQDLLWNHPPYCQFSMVMEAQQRILPHQHAVQKDPAPLGTPLGPHFPIPWLNRPYNFLCQRNEGVEEHVDQAPPFYLALCVGIWLLLTCTMGAWLVFLVGHFLDVLWIKPLFMNVKNR